MTHSIPKDFINELIARADIVEIIDRRITLKKKGSSYSACCPFHNEKTPSFTVSQPKQFYYCFGCGAHGNVIGFLMAYDKLKFPEAVEELATYLGLPIPKAIAQQNMAQKGHQLHYELLEKIARYYQSQLNHFEIALAYLKKRGLTTEILQRFNIGFAPPGWDNLRKKIGHAPDSQAALLETGMLIKNDQQKIYDRFRERIMFPIKDSRGRMIAFGGRTLGDDTPKYLNSPETPLFHKGSELYGLYEARQHNRVLKWVLVVEGYMDVITLHQFGITQSVATLGTATSQTHLQHLFRYTDEIIICFDGDRAGKDAAWRALEVSLPVIRDGLQLKFMFLPEGEDPDSFLRKQGKEAFETYVAQAITFPDFFFATLCQQADIKTVEGKAKLSKLAYPLIQKIRNGVFQTLMMEKLSLLAGVSVEKLHHFYLEPQQDQSEHVPMLPKKPVHKTNLLSPLQLAIALLLQHPQLAEQAVLPTRLERIKRPGIEVLLEMLAVLKANPKLSTGALLENWRESKHVHRLAELATCELLTPENGLEAEFNDSLKKIAILEREDLIHVLLNKAKQSELSAEEKNCLISLLKDRH